MKTIFLSILFFPFILADRIGAGTSFSQADSLYLLATQAGSIDAFREVLEVDESYAPAHLEIAKLYMSLNTPEDRKRAELEMRKALSLDPENEEYQLTLADIKWSQGFRRDAEQLCQKVLEINPNNARAAYWIGYRAVKQFLKYQHMETLGKDVYVEKERERGISYLTRCIDSDSTFRSAFYQLGLLYFETGDLNGLVRTSRQLLKKYPGDKDALLFVGLGYQRMGEEEIAYLLYTDALERMAPEERAVMEKVDYIAGEDEKARIEQAHLQSQDTVSTALWTDNPEREGFWQRQDPLLLTRYNERRMEHYGRVAYANLRFGRPRKGISGWQTDMGKTHIKFGRPLHKFSRRPDFIADREVSEGAPSVEEEVSRDLEGPVSSVEYHLETWVYDDFELRFRNWDGLDAWRWEGYLFEEALAASRRGKWPGHPRETFEKELPRFVDPYKEKKYTMPHLAVGFREADSVRIELAYAIPRSKLKLRAGPNDVLADNGIFLFNESWAGTYRSLDRLPALVRAGTDSIKDSYFLMQEQLRTAPGSYTLAAEVLDRVGGSIGTFREAYWFSFPDKALAMSDLLLASDIETLEAFPENRADLKIAPNPLRTYPRSDLVFIYMELYNLTRDEFGRTQYDVTYSMGAPGKREIDPALFEAMDFLDAEPGVEVEAVTEREGPFDEERVVDYRVRYVLPERNRVSEQYRRMRRGAGVETAVTARYEGDQEDDFIYLKIDVSEMPQGIYKLTVRIKDVRTGHTSQRDALLRLIE